MYADCRRRTWRVEVDVDDAGYTRDGTPRGTLASINRKPTQTADEQTFVRMEAAQQNSFENFLLMN